MLIEFTVGNYRSFKEPQTLSMVAAPIRSRDKAVDLNNIIETDGQPDLLSSAAIYGANASGKSNLIQALDFMRHFVQYSPRRTEGTGGIEVEPFRLSLKSTTKPSFFEIAFIVDGTRHRYGFEVTQERVEREWLYFVPTTREARLFERDGDRVEVGDYFPEGKDDLIGLTRPNSLFLSVVAQFNGRISQNLLNWFLRSLSILSTGRTLGLGMSSGNRTIRYMENPTRAKEVSALIQRLDLGIRDIQMEEVVRQMPLFFDEEFSESDGGAERARKGKERRERRITTIHTVHTLYDEEDQPAGEERFDLNEHESEGTRRLFAIAGTLLDTLQHGRIMIVDELDAQLHPLMTRELVRLFNDRETNPKGAQLIFATQDTNLLDNTLFRRDQIWFVEKNRQGASNLYSLAEFKGIRNDLSLERNYIQGRFGAIPYLNFNKLQALMAEEYVEEA